MSAAIAQFRADDRVDSKNTRYQACREQVQYPIVAADYVRSGAVVQCLQPAEHKVISPDQLSDLAKVVRHSQPGSGASIAGDKSKAFFAIVSRRVSVVNQIDAYEAALTEACAKAERNSQDTTWFDSRQTEPRGYQAYRDICAKKMGEVREAVAENYSDFRLGLAIGYPQRTPSNYNAAFAGSITQAGLDSVVPRTLSQPYMGLPPPRPLTSVEQKEAFEKIRDAVEKTRRDLLPPSSPAVLRGRFSDYQDEAHIAQVVDLKFRVEYEAKYQTALAKAPILAYLNSDRPTSDELIAAAHAVSVNAKEVAEKPLVLSDLARYPNVIEQVLREHPEWCGVAQGWAEDRDLEAKKAEKMKFAVGVAIGAQCALTGWTGVGGVLCLGESVAWSGKAIADNYAAVNAERTFALSSALSSEKAADLAGLARYQRELAIETLFAPLSGFGAGKALRGSVGGTARVVSGEAGVARRGAKSEVGVLNRGLPQPPTGYELSAKTGAVAQGLESSGISKLPKDWEEGALQHIFVGTFSGNKIESGLHTKEALDEFTRATGQAIREIKTDTNGVQLAIWEGTTGAFNKKGKREAIRGARAYGVEDLPAKTLFPASWSREKTVRAIQQAFDGCRNRVPIESCVEVVDGVPIRSVINRETHKLRSAFPVFAP